MGRRLSEHGSEQGMILLSSLAILLGLIVIGLGAGTMLQNDFRISANLRESTEAFYYSAAGLEFGKRELARNEAFPPTLTSQTVSFSSGAFSVSFHSAIVVDPLRTRVVVRSVGTRGPARHLIEAQLMKTYDLADAALALRGNGSGVGLSAADILLSGADHDSSGARIANTSPKSAVSVDSANLQSILSQTVESRPGALETGMDAQSLAHSDDLPSSLVSQLADELCASQAATVHAIPSTGALTFENQVWGTDGAPQLHCFEGQPEAGDAVTFAGGIRGVGILVVKSADLILSGEFRWDGWMIVTGSDVGLKASGEANKQLFGAAVVNEIGNPGAERKIVDFEGAIRIAFSRSALGHAVPLIPDPTLTAVRIALPATIAQGYWRSDAE